MSERQWLVNWYYCGKFHFDVGCSQWYNLFYSSRAVNRGEGGPAAVDQREQALQEKEKEVSQWTNHCKENNVEGPNRNRWWAQE